jgi:hypothetical protein
MYLKRPVHQIGLLRWVLSFEQVSQVWAFQSRSSEMSADGFQWFVVGLLWDAEKHSSLGYIFCATWNLATSFLLSLAIWNSGIYLLDSFDWELVALNDGYEAGTGSLLLQNNDGHFQRPSYYSKWYHLWEVCTFGTSSEGQSNLLFFHPLFLLW